MNRPLAPTLLGTRVKPDRVDLGPINGMRIPRNRGRLTSIDVVDQWSPQDEIRHRVITDISMQSIRKHRSPQ